VKEGEKSVSLHFEEKDTQTDKWEKKSVQLYNIAQTTNPQALREWVVEQEQEKIENMKAQFSESYKPPEPKQRVPGPEIVCTSTNPEKYLGQYLAAVSMGGKFKVSPEQAKEFSQKLESSLFEKMENGHTNPFKLSKISNAASQYCKEVKNEFKTESRKAAQQEQTRGRSL